MDRPNIRKKPIQISEENKSADIEGDDSNVQIENVENENNESINSPHFEIETENPDVTRRFLLSSSSLLSNESKEHVKEKTDRKIDIVEEDDTDEFLQQIKNRRSSWGVATTPRRESFGFKELSDSKIVSVFYTCMYNIYINILYIYMYS